jgi:two-component system phosphate regulon sensor histidine kinase PhoR
MPNKKGLIWQLYPPYLFITIISLIAVIWYASTAFGNFFLKQAADDLEARALLIEKQIAAYLSPVDAKSVDRICKVIGKNSSTRITVVIPSGRVIGDSEEYPEKMDNHADRPEIISALDGKLGTSIRYSRTLQANIRSIYVAVPLKKNDRTIAVLRTSIPVSIVDEKLSGIQIKIAFGGLLVALLAAGISLIISRRVSRPVEIMKQGAERFARGDLEHRLHVTDSKEMASLSNAMNQMAALLDDRIKTVIRHKNELETVLSSMTEGIIAVDMEERIISMNQAAARMFESDPPSVQGRILQEVIRNLQLQQLVKKSLSGEKSVKGDVVLYQNGEHVLYIHTTPLRDSNEERVGTLLVMNDVTQLRRLENMRRDFAANVSHEIKTPLTAIKGFVETLCHGVIDNPVETKRFLYIIEKHVNRLAAIIEDLMKLSRIEEADEKKEIKLEKNEIKGVIQTAIQICQPKAEEKSIKINLSCEEGIRARVNPPLLEQAVVNLIDNAIKYSGPESTVQVEVVQKETELNISVEDCGMGIAREHLPRLFERFYRVDKARSRKLGGTGLGLAIVKHIVQSHGGLVSVESMPGKGSTFTIHLPKG